LFVLGGEWGQNFSVKKYDFDENLIDEYTVALYATDIKLLPEQTEITNDELPVTDYQLTNYPNPFNPSTEIRFQITDFRHNENTKIEIFNLKGQKVKTLDPYNSLTFASKELKRSKSITWNGTSDSGNPVSSGVYLYELKVDGKVVGSRKMLLMK
jgi:flagellar hook assembly protein FlgD